MRNGGLKFLSLKHLPGSFFIPSVNVDAYSRGCFFTAVQA